MSEHQLTPKNRMVVEMGTSGWFFDRDESRTRRNASTLEAGVVSEMNHEFYWTDPDVLAQEIIEDLEAALEPFREIAADLGTDVPTEKDDR
jgi:hypothetical protein